MTLRSANSLQIMFITLGVAQERKEKYFSKIQTKNVTHTDTHVTSDPDVTRDGGYRWLCAAGPDAVLPRPGLGSGQ